MKKTKSPANSRTRTRARGEHRAPRQHATHAERRAAAEHHNPAELEAVDSFQIFLNQASRFPLLTAPEEIDLAKRIERGDLDAKERLVNSNLRLVVSIARRYQGFGLPLQDLVQEAMLGLIRAAEKFSTYATLWIRQSIQRGLDNSGRTIRVPANVAQQLRSLNRAETELTAKLDREPTEEELAAHSKFSVEEVAALHDLTRVTTSLDVQIGDSETTLGELRADEAPPPEDEVVDRQREEAIGRALESLPAPERKVLELRFGTGGEPEATLRDIGRRLGISQSRARQLEAQGLDRLAAAGSLDAWREEAA
jgi:RNA polymerase primary sigma factor